MELSERDAAILRVLDEQDGFTGGQIATRLAGGPIGASRRRRSVRLRGTMQRLWNEGLVARFDDEMPIAWVRTAAGTAAPEERLNVQGDTESGDGADVAGGGLDGDAAGGDGTRGRARTETS